MTLKIAFHSNAMTLRGTEIAFFDYALHNQTILGNESVVFYNPNVSINDPMVIEKFKACFELVSYSDFSEVNGLAVSKHVDAMYLIKSGRGMGELFKKLLALFMQFFHSLQ
jgi:hypothetical protein